jgi:hypothetical protein
VTRAEKSFASAQRSAPGFWRVNGHNQNGLLARSPLTGKFVSPPAPSLTKPAELPDALTGGAAEHSNSPDGHASFPSGNLPAAKRQLRPTTP